MTRGRRWLWVGLALLVCGCGDDVDRLGRIGAKTADNFQNIAGGPHGKIANGWQTVRAAVGDAPPDARVAVRLGWDKQLAGADIRATSTGPGVVRLEGTVADDAHKKRAQEVAESTAGVEQVVNDLTITP